MTLDIIADDGFDIRDKRGAVISEAEEAPDWAPGLRALLDAVSPIPMPQSPAPTLLEVLGVEGKELAASNVLAFFLDPARQHGLGSLVLDALLEAAGEEPTTFSDDMQVDVRTEVLTEATTRIDIQLEGPDFVCCIENKLHASLYNDLETYGKHARQCAGEDKRVVLLVLCLRPPTPEPDLFGFKILTYDKLFERVESRLGAPDGAGDSRYLTLLADFIHTLRQPERHTMTADSEFLTVARDREDELEHLLALVKQLTDDARRKVDDVRAAIDARLERCTDVAPKYLGHSTGRLYDSILYEVPHRGRGELVLGIRLQPAGWSFRIKAKNTTVEAVQQDLRGRGLSIEPIPDERDRLRFTEFDFAWGDSNEEVGAAAAKSILELTKG